MMVGADVRKKVERLCRYIGRPAALVPKSRAHLTRYHGVFVPHSRWRSEVTPAGRGNPRRLTHAPRRSGTGP